MALSNDKYRLSNCVKGFLDYYKNSTSIRCYTSINKGHLKIMIHHMKSQDKNIVSSVTFGIREYHILYKKQEDYCSVFSSKCRQFMCFLVLSTDKFNSIEITL